MADLPLKPQPLYRNALELDDIEKVRAAARAAYHGKAGAALLSDAAKEREGRRAERERRAAKAHYLGPPQRPR